MGGGFDTKHGANGTRHGATSHVETGGLGPGRRTLVEQLEVQRSTNPVAPEVGADAGAVQRAAAHGVAGAGGTLPHAETIQRQFGRHDISGVEAHVGGDAALASREIGAEAYATGHHVAFAKQPSLHTAAHEAAHVIQQRGGVQLKGGVGEAGDAYERHADAVADAVVQGKSAESLLDGYARGGGSAAVQRQPADASPAQQPEGHVDRLIQLLTAPAPADGSRDEAYLMLSPLGISELLALMDGVADRGYLPQLHARVMTWTNPFSAARLLSACTRSSSSAYRRLPS